MTIRAGNLDHRIALQRATNSHSPSGAPIQVWTTMVERWSEIVPVSGDERNAAQQWIAREQTKFTMRWSPEIDDLSPVDRIIFPAPDAANSPLPSRSIYDIITVHELGRHEAIVVVAARRAA